MPTLRDTPPVLWPWATAMVPVLGLALCLPFEMNVFVMGTVGVLHIACALRYLVGRTVAAIPRDGGVAIIVWLTAMALVRLVSFQWSAAGHRAEIIASSMVMCLVALLVCRGPVKWVVIGVMVVVTVLGTTHLGWWMFAATHIHNLVPVVLVLDWARRLTPGTRRMVESFLVIWALIIPVVLVSGIFSPPVAPRFLPGTIHADALVAAVAPPGADTVTAMRWYVTFCFMQGMHYLFWMGFTQVVCRDTVARGVRVFPPLGGKTLWIVVAVLTVVVGGLQVWNYPIGRIAYSALGAYNVHYEMATLVVVISQLVPRHGQD